nr:MAG TPA: hypothetical protein [Caudoviricetes sp.]
MRNIIKGIAVIYTFAYLFMWLALLFVWEMISEQLGGVGIAIMLVSATVNLILLWALSGLESRVRDLENMHKERDENDEY